MSGKVADTIGGFNSMLQKQQSESDNIIWTTVLFDDQYEVIHDRVPVQKVKPLTRETYYARGTTALLDALGKTITRVRSVHRAEKDAAPESTLLVITTDGKENDSHEFSLAEVRRLIEEQQEEGWEILCLGAYLDAVKEAERIGIRACKHVEYLDDREGIRKSSKVIGEAITSMRVMKMLDDDCLDELRRDREERGPRRGRWDDLDKAAVCGRGKEKDWLD